MSLDGEACEEASQVDSGFQDDDTDLEEDTTNSVLQLLILQHKHLHLLMMQAIQSIGYKILAHSNRSDPIPYHTSILTGEMWVLELLNGHPDRIRTELGVQKHVFRKLIDDLKEVGCQPLKFVMLEEQLAIFLYTCVTGLSSRHVGERFQRSNGTISKYFRKMSTIFSSPGLYTKYVRLPRTDDPVPPRIALDPDMFPFFKDALGALDGTHIACAPSAADREATRNRKGFHSLNCLVACNFNLEFMYVLSGWEGSTADASVYHDARTTNFVIPEGKYYLGDAGYPTCPQLLVPYRGVRYHLPEWKRTNMAPTTAEELFNMRHAQLRNIVERIIGVIKRRFRILDIPPEYNLGLQAQTHLALCCIHNFIRCHNPTDEIENKDTQAEAAGLGIGGNLADVYGTIASGFITNDEREAMVRKRDEIAQQLWYHYHHVH